MEVVKIHNKIQILCFCLHEMKNLCIPKFKVCLFSKSCQTCSNSEHEGGEPKRCVHRYKSCSECCSRSFTAQKDYETEEAYNKL